VRISGRDSARHAGTRHRGRRVALVVLLAGSMAVTAVIAGVVLLAATPGVGDAQGRWQRSCGSTGAGASAAGALRRAQANAASRRLAAEAGKLGFTGELR
jgi:hypothetical protein